MPRIRPPGAKPGHQPDPDTLRWKHKGAHSEMVACAWLLAQGYEVFRNISPHGLSDVIAQKGGTILLLDVKSVETTKLSKEQVEAGVLPLYVSSSGHCKIGFRSS